MFWNIPSMQSTAVTPLLSTTLPQATCFVVCVHGCAENERREIVCPKQGAVLRTETTNEWDHMLTESAKDLAVRGAFGRVRALKCLFWKAMGNARDCRYDFFVFLFKRLNCSNVCNEATPESAQILTNLPDDVYYNIFSFCNLRTLLLLPQICHRFRNLIVPSEKGSKKVVSLRWSSTSWPLTMSEWYATLGPSIYMLFFFKTIFFLQLYRQAASDSTCYAPRNTSDGI